MGRNPLHVHQSRVDVSTPDYPDATLPGGWVAYCKFCGWQSYHSHYSGLIGDSARDHWRRCHIS